MSRATPNHSPRHAGSGERPGVSLLPGLVSVKGCTNFADVCAVNADSLAKLFARDAEGLRPLSDVRDHLGVDLVRVEGSSLFWMLEGYGACNDV